MGRESACRPGSVTSHGSHQFRPLFGLWRNRDGTGRPGNGGVIDGDAVLVLVCLCAPSADCHVTRAKRRRRQVIDRTGMGPEYPDTARPGGSQRGPVPYDTK